MRFRTRQLTLLLGVTVPAALAAQTAQPEAAFGAREGVTSAYEKLDHYLEDSAARADMLKRSDTFLKASFAK